MERKTLTEGMFLLPLKNISKALFLILALNFFSIIAYCETFEASTPEVYPNVKIFGYKKYLYNSLNTYDMVTPEAYFTDNYYSRNWNEELKLTIDGNLSDQLSLFYDLHQLPRQSDSFNVGITYRQNRLMFGSLNDIYYSEHFLPWNVAGVIASTTFWGFTPFVVSNALMNTVVYDDEDSRLLIPMDYVFKDPRYYGSEAFPAHGNLENRYDKEYWLKERKLIDGYSLFDHPDSYKNITPQSNRLFLIGKSILPDTEMVYVDGQRRFKDIDYDLDYSRGDLLFKNDLSEISEVNADFSILNIENKNDASGGGLAWKPNNDVAIVAGYLSSTPKTSWNQDFSTTNLSARYLISKDQELQLDLNTSDYGKGASRESVGASSLAYNQRIGKFTMYVKMNSVNFGYAYPIFVMLGEKERRDQSSALLEYDLSGGYVTNGKIRLGETRIYESTFEAGAHHDTDAYFMEANNTFNKWLEITNRYQKIEAAYKFTATPNADVTDSLLNTASINLDRLSPLFGDKSKLFYKDLQESYRYGYVPYEGLNRNELGTLQTFGPYTLLLSRGIATATSSSMTSEVSSQYRLTYRFEPMHMDIIFDYTEMDGGFGSILYNDVKREIGYVLDIPTDGMWMIISRVYLGVGFRFITHRENRGSDYSYDANQMHFNCAFYF